MVHVHWFGRKEWLKDGEFAWAGKAPSFTPLKNPHTNNRAKWVTTEPLSSILPIIPELTRASTNERNREKPRITAECDCVFWTHSAASVTCSAQLIEDVESEEKGEEVGDEQPQQVAARRAPAPKRRRRVLDSSDEDSSSANDPSVAQQRAASFSVQLSAAATRPRRH
eukprot:6204678-Pleurochrysis_carterae.AAC.4